VRDTQLANRLRALGVRVIEVDGWQSRGSDSYAPVGGLWHHTAGPSSGATPSLGTCINGRPDVAGPLCNVMQSREPDGNDIAYVIAAGKGNHGGEGSWRGVSGNSKFAGLEVEHTGIAPLGARKNISVRILAAMVQGFATEEMCCQHSEYAPSRKIDIANDTDPNWYRQQCGLILRGGGAPIPPPDSGDFDLSQQQYDSIMKRLDQLESQVQSVGSGQNKHIELSSDIKKDVLNSRARLVRSADGVYFVVTPEGRWRIENSGQFSVKNMIDWLTVVGLIAPGDSVKADDDYLHGVPKLADPGKVPST
jgi:hypothetical protein